MTTEQPVSFGGMLRRFRLAVGLSQEALAERAGLSARGISDLERGARQAPRPDTVDLLAAALGLAATDRAALAASVRRARQPAPVAPAPAGPDASPAGRAPAPRHNLPLQLTSFIGRQAELAELPGWLRAHRLVTLAGAGGIGKTRLGLQLAPSLLGAFADGVWFVEFAPLADASLIPATVAAAVGIHETPHRSIETTLIETLRGRHLLLILDNCEHLVDACARFAEAVLRHCPRVHLLASSREPLGVAGERVFRVPSLALLDPARLLPAPDVVADLAASEAVGLFVDRAVAGQPRFALTAQNAVAVAQICQRLDGIPLAIELAAARVRALSVEQIAARLDDRFRLLTVGSRTALPRQQTLRALIDWSYDLLAEPERVLLHRLSVFAGGWTLEAAEAVCADAAATDELSILPPDTIVDHLSSLVEKSLVTFESTAAEPRYSLNETVRQYARDRLQATDEAARVRARHHAWCLALAEAAEPALRGATQPEWLRHLAAEQANLRAALDWSLAEPGDRAGPRLAVALFWCWYFRSQWHEARSWFDRALTCLEAPPCPGQGRRLRARVLACAGEVAVYQGDFATARAWLAESFTLARAVDDRATLAYVRLFQSSVGHQGDDVHRDRRAWLGEAIDLFRDLDDRWGQARALQRLGLVDMHEGHAEPAEARLGESLQLFEATGDVWGTGMAKYCLGLLAQRRRDFAVARPWLEQGLLAFRRLDTRGMMAQTLNTLGDLARTLGEAERASSLYEEALALFREVDSGPGIAGALHNLGYLALHRTEPARAASLFLAAHARFQQDRNAHGALECLVGLGAVAAASGRAERAVRLFAATDALLARMQRTRSASNVADYERALAAARAALTPDAFTTAWEAGAALPLEAATCEAQHVVESSPAVEEPAGQS